MANQAQRCFERCEKKYWLTRAQQRALLDAMRPYMTVDRYGAVYARHISAIAPEGTQLRRETLSCA